MRNTVTFITVVLLAAFALAGAAEADIVVVSKATWTIQLGGGAKALHKSDGVYWFEYRTDAPVPTPDDWRWVIRRVTDLPAVDFQEIRTERCPSGLCGIAKVKFP